MKKLLISKTPERSVDDILEWDYDKDTLSLSNNVQWWDYRLDALSFFNNVNDGLINNKGFNEEILYWNSDNDLYIICPTPLEEQPKWRKLKVSDYAYSLILGYFIVKEKNRKFKFYASPETLYWILRNIHLYKHPLKVYWDDDCKDDRLCYYIGELIDFNIVDYFQKQNNIEIGFHCPKCKVQMDENSFSSILDSNLGINDFKDVEHLICPICGNEIPLNKKKKDMLRSYDIIYKYHRFSEKELGNEFQLLFLYNLFNNKKDSNFLREFKLENISDSLCQELFGIPINEFVNIRFFFRMQIEWKIWEKVKDFINDENDPEYAGFINSKLIEATRYVRRKKLKRLAEIRRNQNGNFTTEYTSE